MNHGCSRHTTIRTWHVYTYVRTYVHVCVKLALFKNITLIICEFMSFSVILGIFDRTDDCVNFVSTFSLLLDLGNSVSENYNRTKKYTHLVPWSHAYDQWRRGRIVHVSIAYIVLLVVTITLLSLLDQTRGMSLYCFDSSAIVYFFTI